MERLSGSMTRARRTLSALALAAAVGCARPAPLGTAPVVDSAAAAAEGRIAADVAWLAAPARQGRYAGTPQSDSTAAYLVRRYQALGLTGAFPAECSPSVQCAAAYVQPFTSEDGAGHNVAARIPGTDSSVADEYVIVGAHADHIGHSAWLSLDPERGSVVRPGADDNASGTAAVLELARRLAAHPTRRSVLVVHFDAEELGLLGSKAFVARPPVPRGAVRLMVNFDMVGRLRGRTLFVEVDRGGRALAALVDSAARADSLRATSTAGTKGRSDHATFDEWGVPAVALFTGYHDDYHSATDVPSRVNVRGIRRVVDVAESIVRTVADRP
jgi:Zn-dependent M28 family amino/carboxypeptidase